MKEDCPWRVHAYKGKWNDYWKVSIVTEHKCYLQGVEKYHRNITSAFVASEMYSNVVGNISFEPKSIIRHIENKFKYTISYAKAWRAKQKIIETRYGTFETSYDNLPRLLATIAQRNNNTYYDLHTLGRRVGGIGVRGLVSSVLPLQSLCDRFFWLTNL